MTSTLNTTLPVSSSSIIKNLLYHIWPTKGRGVWEWNVTQLLRRIDQFNGQRIVVVVTDKNSDSLETVKAAFKGTVKDFLHYPNNPALGETVGFYDLLKRVENIDPRQITFYGHAKGVKYAKNCKHMVHRWAEVMYSNLLDYPTLVEDALRKYPIAGTFLKSGNSFGGLPPSWHFAGTFFWLRNLDLFSMPSWHNIPRDWWGTEAWPGITFSKEKAVCMLMPGAAPSMQLYARPYWVDVVNPVWQQWQIDNSHLRASSSYREVLNTLSSLKTQRIVVTGPQRSGTTIGAKILAHDLKLPYLTEENFETYNHAKFTAMLRGHPKFVIQAPTMSAYVHLLPYTVVWMRRQLSDILRSQQRINWGMYEQQERDCYFEHSHRPSAVIKTEAWEKFQRIALGERAFDLDYTTLQGHPMWVDPEGRKDFHARQTYPSR